MARRGDVRDEELEGELPGGLWFTDEEPVLPPPAHPGARRLLSALVVLALLGGAVLLGVRWTGASDVRDVLASSTRTYARVLGAVGSASDPEALAAAAALAPRAAERLAADLGRLRPDGGERRAAVAAQVEAERGVLAALAPLERLADGPLEVWGRAHAGLTATVEAEARSRSRLGAVDPAAAGRLPDTPAAVRRAAATVGSALVDDVQQAAAALLDALQGARTTADLRAAGDGAAAQRDAAAAAQDGLGGDAGVLAAFTAALDAATGLREVTPAETSGWPALRGRLSEQLRTVADADDSLAAGSVRARLPLVLAAVDRVVAAAADAHAEWQPRYDAAVAAQAADRAALQRYADAVRSLGEDQEALRAAAAALRARGGTADDVLREADRLAADGERLLAVLRTAAVPAGVEDAHAGLVAALERVAGPPVRAFEELRTQVCPGCPASDAPSWSQLGAADPWPTAVAAWEPALAEADAAVAARALPPPPDA
ncbi:MAG TPA: hypothetical protein VNU66_12085 [Mycobacteriales bacterium]|nr:hypothetical protein [Mycobacteriales bacterium]